MWADLQVGRLRNGDRRPEVGGNLLSGSVTTSFATDMDVRFQARSRCHIHFRTKSRPWQPNQTMLGRIKHRKLTRKWNLQIRPTHNTRHAVHAAWASLAFHFTVPINARDSTNDCWTCTLAESAYYKGPERREERCTCAPERNAKPASACRYSGIKFTMLPQPIWTEWNTSVTRPLQAVDEPWNPSHDPWGKLLPTWKTYSSRLCPIRHVGKQMREAWKLVPLHQLPSAWNIDWALLDETYPSAAEKIRRGFHNIRLVCHPNHFRLIQESGSFNFVNVYGTVRHDLVIAAKINFTRVTNQTFLGQITSWRAWGSMATSNINIRVKRTVQSSCSPRFMDVAACDLKALKDQSCMFDSMSCFFEPGQRHEPSGPSGAPQS